MSADQDLAWLQDVLEAAAHKGWECQIPCEVCNRYDAAAKYLTSHLPELARCALALGEVERKCRWGHGSINEAWDDLHAIVQIARQALRALAKAREAQR